MSKLTLMFIYMIIGNVMAWFQLQGQFMGGRFAHIMKQDWTVVVLGIPIGWLFWRSATLSYEYFGAVWNIRLIGFGVGTIIFAILTMSILKELPGWHSVISVILAAVIIMLQFANLK